MVMFQWFFWGYSLAFSTTTTNGYIGDLRHFGLRKVLGLPSPGSALIPELLFSFFQMEVKIRPGIFVHCAMMLTA